MLNYDHCGYHCAIVHVLGVFSFHSYLITNALRHVFVLWALTSTMHRYVFLVAFGYHDTRLPCLSELYNNLEVFSHPIAFWGALFWFRI